MRASGEALSPVEREYGDLDVYCDDRPEYRLESRARTLADFEPTCWWHRTSPRSHSTRSLTCSLLTDSGRLTLSGRRLIRTQHGRRSEDVLASEADVREAYRRHFEIVLDRVPTVRPPVS